MAERRRRLLRRANARAKKQDRGRKGIKELLHLDAMLLENSKAARARRNGGAALESSSGRTSKAPARLGFAEAADSVRWGFRGRGACFYRGGAGPWRAGHAESEGACSGARTRGGVPARPELGDDGRVPRVGERGERKRGVTGWAEGKGKRAGGGGFWPAGNEKEKGRVMGWAGKGLGERKKFSIFKKGFKHFQFKFKLKDLNLS